MRYNRRGCQVTEYRCLRTSCTDKLELDREASTLPTDTDGLQRRSLIGKKRKILLTIIMCNILKTIFHTEFILHPCLQYIKTKQINNLQQAYNRATPKYHLYVTRGCRGRKCAGPKSILQPELVRVRSPPSRANIRREPLFRTQARKRLSGDQLTLATQ